MTASKHELVKGMDESDFLPSNIISTTLTTLLQSTISIPSATSTAHRNETPAEKFLLKYLPLLHVPYSLRKSLLKYSICLRKLFKMRLQMKFKMLIHPNLLDFKLYLMLMLTNLIRIMRMTTLKEKL